MTFRSVFIKRVGAVLIGTALIVVPVIAGVISGFQGPLFGLATSNGKILVADASTGIIKVRNKKVRRTIALPGVTDVSPIGRRSMWAVTGAGPAPGLPWPGHEGGQPVGLRGGQ